MNEIVEIECEKCGKKIYVEENFVRQKMFCTLGCLDSYKEISPKHNGFHDFTRSPF